MDEKSEDQRGESFWNRSYPLPQFGPLRENLTADVCIVGGGITGLTCAYLLLKEGLSIIILESESLFCGETARTTAHLTQILDERFYHLEKIFGEESTMLAAQSHAAAIDFIEKTIHRENIECQFERVDAHLFAPTCNCAKIYQELSATERMGLNNVELIKESSLPFFEGPFLKFSNQAQFHPTSYLHALVLKVLEMGGRIFTNTHVNEVDGGHSCRILTKDQKVHAKAAIVATNSPVNTRFLIHTKQASYRTYAIAGKLPKDALQKGLYFDTEDPYHYVRLAEKEGETWLIVGGEDHKTGQNKHPEACYNHLENWIREKIPALGEIKYRWSGQVVEPMDSLAFIGRCPMEKNVYIATGFSGNGITHGTIAGLLISDLILNKTNEWEKLYDPTRISLKALPEFFKENSNTAIQYADWLSPGEVSDINSIPCSSGAIYRNGLEKLAIYKDESGNVTKLSAICPHLGGIVAWNHAEKTWDCPCHGSRFNLKGEVINGPASSSLEKIMD